MHALDIFILFTSYENIHSGLVHITTLTVASKMSIKYPENIPGWIEEVVTVANYNVNDFSSVYCLFITLNYDMIKLLFVLPPYISF